ncbi:cell adhesion molecule Dscam2-like isoform X2 [Hetaerina americana]|uniref:cell adhesion molecule Dscam2-like isoform X2 n=1 Tax=Hetaerina americana TaxID=62018 RepID=UPI003A7F3969
MARRPPRLRGTGRSGLQRISLRERPTEPAVKMPPPWILHRGRPATTLTLGLAFVSCFVGVSSYLTESRGPRFTLEPPPLVLFSNATGARVDCAAEGTPPPRVEWLLADGSPAPSVPSTRLALGNGTLLFPPFRGEAFRPDVHTATYRCSAANTAGRIISLDVQVRAVVLQHYEISVYDAHVVLGNTAVLRCNIPSFVKDYMAVTSWLQDNHFNIYPSIEGDQKHLMLPSGDLYVLNANPSDGYSSYRCRTLHKLTGITQESSTAGKVVVTEPKGVLPPRFNEKSSAVIGRRGEDAVIPCTAQGHPTPSYLWFRKLEGIFRQETVTENERRFLLGGSLVLRNVQAEDAGFYVCSANNSGGSASLEVQLRVLAPVGVHLQPSSLLVDSGQSAEFICVATGLPPPETWWLKDGQRIRLGGDGTSATVTGNGERIVVTSAQREDQGMYQCVAQSENDMAQSTAELRLGASKPQLLYKFIQQTLQPGPDVSLKCIATGQPTPQIQWTLDGFPLPQNERFMIGQYATVSGDVISHVNISKVSVEDGGNYACAAINRVGITFHTAPLHVYGLPMVRKMPPISAVAGEPLYVTCPAAGFPIAGINWEKDGRILPVNHRQTVHPNGTLVVMNVQQRDDRGTYSCTVKNRQGHSDRGTVEITVTEPPSIYPFSIQNSLHLGERIGLQCIVTKGDPPLSITWLKDDHPINELPNLTVKSLGEYSSTLMIEQLSTTHSGRYTCTARNAAASAAHTVRLAVNVPPEWLTEPKDTSAIAGHPVGLHCQADGFPAPRTTWRKAPGKHPAHFAPINSRDGLVTVLSNGTLLIRSVLEEHEGYYLCEANNGIGAGLSAVVFLTVNALPRFVTSLRKETVRKGSTASFLCEASGDQPMQIVWKRDGIRLTSESSHRYHIKENALEASAFSQFLIRHVTSDDSGKYLCIASNPFGKDETVVELMVQDVPEAPTDVRVMESRSRSVKLSWTEPDEGNSPILQYTVVYTTDPGPVTEINSERQTYDATSSYASEWAGGVQQGGSSTKGRSFAEVTKLRPSTTYYFRVAGVNQLGRGSLSGVVSGTTDPEAPSGPPRSLTALPMGERALRVTWLPPDEEHWNGAILGYYLGLMQASGAAEGRFNYTTVKAAEGRGGDWILRGLKSFTKYKVTAQAFNSAGAGPSSEEVTAMTLEGVPTAPPQDIKCQPLTSQSIQLVWQSPPIGQQNGNIKGYKVNYESTDDTSGYMESEVKETSEHLTSIHGLQKYANYSVRVAAFTGAGIGTYSEPISCLTAEDVPGPPSNIRVALSAPYTAIVSWSPPEEAHGVLIRYQLYEREVRRGSGDPTRRSFLATQTQATIGPLREHSSYEFWVTAATRIGEGPSTKVVSISPNSRVPASILSFGKLHALPWRSNALLACQFVGIPRPELHWTHDLSPVSFSQRMRLMDNGSLSIHEIQKQDHGNYTCHVKNVHNTERIVHIVKVLVPPPAPRLEVLSIGSHNVTLQWGWGPGVGAAEAAADAGGPIIGYVLSYKRELGDWKEVRLGRRDMRHTLTDLPCGTLHFVHIAAFNRVGMGDSSPATAVHTRGERPTAPSGTDAFKANSHSITVHLSKWKDGDCPMRPVLVEKQPEGKGWVTAIAEATPGDTYTLFGLESGTLHNVRITAQNNKGTTVSTYKIYTQSLTEGASTPLDLSLETRKELEKKLAEKAVVEGKNPEPSQPPFYADLRVSVPTGVSLLAVALTLTTVVICLKKKSTAPSISEDPNPAPSTDVKVQYYSALARDQQGMEIPRPPGSPPHAPVTCGQGHIPEYGEDIYPYATFQVQKTNEPQQPTPRGFQTFVYQDSRMMPGEAMAAREGVCGMAPQVETTQRVSHGRSRSLGKVGPNKGLRSDSEEYDSLGSDSDTEHAASSRTESSNQLEDNLRDKNSSFHSYLHGNNRHSHLMKVSESSSTMEPSFQDRRLNTNHIIRKHNSTWKRQPFVHSRARQIGTDETAFTFPSKVPRCLGEERISRAECDFYLQYRNLHEHVVLR